MILSLGVMAAGFFIIAAGILICRNGSVSFIAGSGDMFRPYNEAKLAKRFGWTVISFGIWTILFPILFHLLHGLTGSHFVILAAVHLGAVFVFMLIDQMGL